MAQRTSITYVSDLSGETIDEGTPTLAFGIDGKQYLIDLTEAERSAMRKALEPYLEVAKPAGRDRTTSARRPAAPSDASAVREWAKEHGIEVPDRGRLPKEAKEAYAAAH